MRQSKKPDFDTARAHGDDKPTLQIKKVKASYAVPCSSKFREAVLALADKRGVNVADLARAILLSFPRLIIEKNPDPGGPEPNDREVIILQSGPSQGKPWKRKPRLQVRLPPGYSPTILRKALNIALRLDRGFLDALLLDPSNPTSPAVMPQNGTAQPPLEKQLNQAVEDQKHLKDLLKKERQDFKLERIRLQKIAQNATANFEEITRLKTMIVNLSVPRLSSVIQSRDEALFILGFPPASMPTSAEIKAQFRVLATIYHPDSGVGNNDLMAQLNEAFGYLRRNG